MEVITQGRTLIIWVNGNHFCEESATKLEELRKEPPKKGEKHNVEQDSRIMVNKGN